MALSPDIENCVQIASLLHFKTMMGFFFFFIVGTMLPAVRSEVTVIGPANIPQALSENSWESATLKYYGPQNGPALSGTAAYIESICDSNQWPSVEGKIAVFSIPFSRPCSIDGIYERLSNKNAKAVVRLSHFRPPDLRSHIHFLWNRCRFCQESMLLVTVSDPNDSFRRLLVRHQEDSGVVLQIKSPHSSTMREMYESSLWLLVVRVFLPVYATLTAVVAGYEVYREVSSVAFKPRGPYSPRFVVCVSESPTLIMVGCALALGQYGPTMLPLPIHAACTPLFSGVGLFTTALLAIYLHEMIQSNAGRQEPRRSIWEAHRSLIGTTCIAFVGFDILFLFFVMSAFAQTRIVAINELIAVFTFITALASLFVAASFIYQAFQMRSSVKEFNHRTRHLK